MRSLARLAQRTYDLVILGGGITGACVARDAALRGLRVALVEKRDFCSATSGASSKLIHGGLRYLKNFEFGLVRESLRERRLWELNAPHLVYPLPMLMPVYADGEMSLPRLRAGQLSMASVEPAVHSAPMPKPNSVRRTSTQAKLGASATRPSKTANQSSESMSGNLRP